MYIFPTLASRIFQSASVFFAALIVLSVVAYALTTWSPGGSPQASPDSGNVTPYFLIQTYAGTPSDLTTGQVWIDTTVE